MSLQKLFKGSLFFAITLILLSSFRLFFIIKFGSPSLSLNEFSDSLLLGLRLDAKWLATLLTPAFTVLILSNWYPSLNKLGIGLALSGITLFLFLNFINIGFYAFYHVPISPAIFGLFEDDTKAILKTLWSDWPVIKYAILLLILSVVPFLFIRWYPKQLNKVPQKFVWIIYVLAILVFAIIFRGSLGTFPLRVQNLTVSLNPFINYAIYNGPAALYSASTVRTKYDMDEDPLRLLKTFGFSSEEEARSKLARDSKSDSQNQAALPNQPNVVLAIMESMGRDQFESDIEGVNDSLGALRDVLPSAIVFKNAVSAENGTFKSLEAILFRSPLSPITQTKYGQRNFPFSEINDFKKAGYKTIFLTAGSVSWRQMDQNFPKQGFDQVLGLHYLKSKYPNIEESAWGVGDKWMFKAALDLLQEANAKGEKLFLVLLSVTNHPPFKVPDGDETKPVDPSKIPEFVKADLSGEKARNMMQTFQYASNALGNFITSLDELHLKSNTIVVATGDHNARFLYEPTGWWHHVYGVPIIFWIPDESLKNDIDTKQWISHFDIMPTIKSLVFKEYKDPLYRESVFKKDRAEGALTLNSIGEGFGTIYGKGGAVALTKNGDFTCYTWQKDPEKKGSQLIANDILKCTQAQEEMGKRGAARRGLMDYEIRHEILDGHRGDS